MQTVFGIVVRLQRDSFSTPSKIKGSIKRNSKEVIFFDYQTPSFTLMMKSIRKLSRH